MLHFFYWGTSLTEVCQLLRFDSVSYFSSLFKSVVGLPPGTFRKACLDLGAEARTKINSETKLFISRPLPINDLFASMRQLGEIIANSQGQERQPQRISQDAAF